ncbi:glycosyltransferase family 9 protein [Sabulilitoribacter multivorans]|uniref:Glycosyltransferase family 9 protein n=1 Tax=Flaviramulus multivorans TaxID=1304750 RepID=A0ABS9IME1_9FLAO|nr:glycosyltransferase family 9 protein [Flaviramulus multivorans]MCF7561763.1 glycosyltransferase family 9 protein [Flaviramulus multivorans]
MKILIIQQKMIGDVLTSSILFEALRQKYPKAQLDYLINNHTYPVVQNNPFIDNFIFFTEKEASSKTALFKLGKTVRNKKYDVVIDIYSKFSSNLITLLSVAKTKISKYKWYTSFIYSQTFKELKRPKTTAGLAIENRLRLLEPILNENSQIFQPKIYLTSDEIENSKQLLLNHNIDLNSKLIMISVLGSSENKTYPLPYMAEIIDAIVEETKAQILFNYIPNQKNKAKEVYDLCKIETQKHIFYDVFGNGLREFLAITKHCIALIGNEGGAVNMAKALDIPTFTVFSPWILKEAWNMFEDGKTHVSIHLKDTNPELYSTKSVKDMKTDSKELYHSFKPNLVIPKLKSFLKGL